MVASKFVANTGATLGFDRLISKWVPLCFLAAQPHLYTKYTRLERNAFLGLALLSLVTALYAIPHIRDYSPRSVDDPAMVILVLSTLAGLTALITFLRFREGFKLNVEG